MNEIESLKSKKMFLHMELDEETKICLKKLAKKEERTMANLVRRIVRQYVEGLKKSK